MADCRNNRDCKPSSRLLCIASALQLLHVLVLLCRAEPTVLPIRRHLLQDKREPEPAPQSFIEGNWHRFTCPRGAYQDASPTPLAEKERMLRSHVRWLLREGYQVMPGWETGVQRAGNRMWTYSDPMWPKPAHCRDVGGGATAIQNNCITVGLGRMLISHKYKLSFRLVPKAGGSSIVEAARSVLPGILLLNYWVDVGSKGLPKCHPSVMPEREKEQLYPSVADQRYLVVGNMRDPVDRFISAYNYFARRTGHDPNSTTDFVDVLRKGFECAHYAWGVKEWGYKGFMHFLPATGFFLLPNLLYAPDNDTLPYIDKLFRLEELDELLPYLELVKKGSVSATGPGKAPAVDKLVLAKKPLAVKNARPHDGSSEMFKKLLSDKQDIMRLHCRSFIQDYICFDYPLPEECADMVPW